MDEKSVEGDFLPPWKYRQSIVSFTDDDILYVSSSFLLLPAKLYDKKTHTHIKQRTKRAVMQEQGRQTFIQEQQNRTCTKDSLACISSVSVIWTKEDDIHEKVWAWEKKHEQGLCVASALIFILLKLFFCKSEQKKQIKHSERNCSDKSTRHFENAPKNKLNERHLKSWKNWEEQSWTINQKRL